jgi:hypothetical protein
MPGTDIALIRRLLNQLCKEQNNLKLIVTTTMIEIEDAAVRRLREPHVKGDGHGDRYL